MPIAHRHAYRIVLAAAVIACGREVTTPTPEDTGDASDPVMPVPAGTPITTFTSPAHGECKAPRAKSVLVDPTHDGGVWWFPQAASTPAGFDPDAPHQGSALAAYLRGKGYTVTELGRGATLPTDSMRTYATVIRAGYYYDAVHPGYSAADIDAYRAFLSCSRTLVLLGEFLRDGRRDDIADSLGISLTGMVTGTITDFSQHVLTDGVSSVPFITGSYLAANADLGVDVLGRLPTGEAVMGVLKKGDSKLFFLGDVNGIQLVPQPLVQNLVDWGFH